MSLSEFYSYSKENNADFYETALHMTSEESGKTAEELLVYMEKMWSIMENSANRGVNEPILSKSGMTGCEGYTLYSGAKGEYTRAAAVAMGIANINASMGRIVAVPTAGACGILPGTLTALQARLGCSNGKMAQSLIVAGYVGGYIADNASVSGACHGCQAECGTASAMAAAAGVWLCGGTVRQSFDAAAMTLKAVMGLVCDPVAGLVESPCVKRNAFGTVQALLAVDMSMAGIESVIPFDETVEAMKDVGERMHSDFRETSCGGCAAGKTAKEWECRLNL